MKKTLFVLFFLGSMFASQAQQSYDIYHHVPFIPQPTGVSCWSTSIAMILWWRDNENAQQCLVDALTPAQVAAANAYWNQHFVNGLDGFDSRPLRTWGFVEVPPSSFDVSTFASWLNRSPVWVAYNGCTNPLTSCNHAVVVIGLRGDGTPNGTKVIIHDPDDGSGTYPNLGNRDREMTFSQFVQRLNNRATSLIDGFPNETTPLHFIAYLR